MLRVTRKFIYLIPGKSLYQFGYFGTQDIFTLAAIIAGSGGVPQRHTTAYYEIPIVVTVPLRFGSGIHPCRDSLSDSFRQYHVHHSVFGFVIAPALCGDLSSFRHPHFRCCHAFFDRGSKIKPPPVWLREGPRAYTGGDWRMRCRDGLGLLIALCCVVKWLGLSRWWDRALVSLVIVLISTPRFDTTS